VITPVNPTCVWNVTVAVELVTPDVAAVGADIETANGCTTVTAMHACVEVPHADPVAMLAPAVVPVPLTTRFSTP
jgi:hypothetical protein